MKDNESRMIPAEQSLNLLLETLDDYNQFLTDVNNDKSIKDDYQKMAMVKKRYKKTIEKFADDLNRIPSYEETLKKVTDEPNQHPSKNCEKNEINKLNSHMFGVETTTNDNIQTKSDNHVYNDNFEDFQKEDEKDNSQNSDKPWMTISKKFKEEHKINNNEVKDVIKIAETNDKKEDKKENNNSEKNIDELNIDELVKYINGEGGIKTKKKKKKKGKKEAQINEIKEEREQEDEKDYVFDEFKKNVIENSVNRCNIHKIKFKFDKKKFDKMIRMAECNDKKNKDLRDVNKNKGNDIAK